MKCALIGLFFFATVTAADTGERREGGREEADARMTGGRKRHKQRERMKGNQSKKRRGESDRKERRQVKGGGARVRGGVTSWVHRESQCPPPPTFTAIVAFHLIDYMQHCPPPRR